MAEVKKDENTAKMNKNEKILAGIALAVLIIQIAAIVVFFFQLRAQEKYEQEFFTEITEDVEEIVREVKTIETDLEEAKTTFKKAQDELKREIDEIREEKEEAKANQNKVGQVMIRILVLLL